MARPFSYVNSPKRNTVGVRHTCGGLRDSVQFSIVVISAARFSLADVFGLNRGSSSRRCAGLHFGDIASGSRQPFLRIQNAGARCHAGTSNSTSGTASVPA